MRYIVADERSLQSGRQRLRQRGSDGHLAAMRVLIIGEDPKLVDFSDPAIPPGTTAEKVQRGLDDSLGRLRERGREADLLLTSTVAAAGKEVAAALKRKSYDCIVIGAGLRVVPKMTPMFEAIMNAVREVAPQARLAFNLAPDDSDAAAERQLAL